MILQSQWIWNTHNILLYACAHKVQTKISVFAFELPFFMLININMPWSRTKWRTKRSIGKHGKRKKSCCKTVNITLRNVSLNVLKINFNVPKWDTRHVAILLAMMGDFCAICFVCSFFPLYIRGKNEQTRTNKFAKHSSLITNPI